MLRERRTSAGEMPRLEEFIRFAPPTTAERILGRVKEPEGMLLAKAPIFVTQIPSDDPEKQRFMAVANRAIKPAEVHAMIMRNAPDPMFGGKLDGIVGDLHMIVTPDGPNIERNKRHQDTLKEHWSDLMLHHQVITEMMEEAHWRENSSRYIIPYNQARDGLFSLLVRGQYLHPDSWIYQYPVDSLKLFLTKSDVLNRRALDELDKLILELPQDVQEQIVVRRTNLDNVIVAPTPDIPSTMDQQLYYSRYIPSQGGGIIKTGTVFEASVNLQGNHNNRPVMLVLDKSTAKSCNVVYPVMTWTVDGSGNRHLEATPLPEQLSAATLATIGMPEIPEGLEFPPNRANPLFGISFLLYLTPQLGGEWRKAYRYRDIAPDIVNTPGIEAHSQPQNMGPVQTLALMLRQRKDIAQSELLPGLEKHYRNSQHPSLLGRLPFLSRYKR